jgi:hypothetical protein
MEQEFLEVSLPGFIEVERPAGLMDDDDSESEMDLDLRPASEPVPGPIVGLLFGLDEHGRPLICFDGAPGGIPIPARSVIPLSSVDVGREVVLLFERGDAARPLLMGVLRLPRPEPVRTEIDGEKLVFTADREIVLRCGEASITLTRAGKVLIQGAYVLTRSSGANRIKGAVVEIN